MRSIRSILFVVLAAAGLAACFTSPDPLVTAEDAVFPFERITFVEVGQPDKPQTWVRKGDVYSWVPDPNDPGEARLRLKDLGDDLYLAQMEFTEDGQPHRLYGVLKADLAGKRVVSYATVKPDDFVAAPGLSLCDTAVCIDDVDAYVAYAKARIAAGTPPDAEYTITAKE